ncbi:MAG: hypothetical protein ONB05_12420, partial [candidate division KSB1 bacterium]|nr:hypothetical protein [candidate division KSB1 bacterium]
QELAYGVISMVCPIGRFHPGLAFQTFGCPAYRENTAVFSLGSTYQKKMFYGFNLRFHKLDIPGYGSDYCLGLDLGFLITLSPVTTWGFFARNVNRPTLGQDPEELPQIYCTGLSLTPLKTLILNLDMYKDIRYPTEVRAGLEYRLFEALALRTGVGNNPSRFTAGLGILVNIIEVDYAFSTHSDLGLTHQISLTICLNR